MIGYVTLGTNDIARAARFYDALLAEFGAKRAMEMESFIAWSTAPGTPMLAVIKPFDKKPATGGQRRDGGARRPAARRRSMPSTARPWSSAARTRALPAPRMPGFYAGYFRDLDGNKLNAFFMG